MHHDGMVVIPLLLVVALAFWILADVPRNGKDGE